MTKTINVMAIAPNQAAAPRTTAQGAQPKYKSATRTGQKNFGSTLEQVHAKLDELKQSVQNLQDANKKLAQVEGETPPPDTEEISAQGTSDTPQDAPLKAIDNDESGIVNDSAAIAPEGIQPADIFFVEDKPSDEPIIKDVPTVKPLETPTLTDEPPETLTTAADKAFDSADELPAVYAASNPAYFFNVNAETLLEAKPAIEVAQVSGGQNLMTVLPQANDDNSQSMLNMLGGKAWRLIETPQAPIQTPTVETQPSQPLQQTIQAPTLETQPSQPLQQTIQPPTLETQPSQPLQQMIQPPTVEAQPSQPLQQTIQAPTVETQPSQPLQQTIQPPTLETQPSQPLQQTIQAPTVETQPSQPLQQTIQAPTVETQPSQPLQQTIQATTLETQPSQPQAPVQAPTVETQPSQPQAPVQAPTVETQPSQPQAPVQAPTVEAQPSQPQAPVQAPTVETQPSQPQATIQAPTVEAQPLQPQQTIQAPTLETQPSQPLQTVQAPTVETQPSQPLQQTIQAPTVETQPSQPLQQTVQPPTVETQPSQPLQQTIQAQAVITPQRVDEPQTVQQLSDLLGVKVEVDAAPTSAPVTPPQSTPQQFNQPQQQDARNFQGQAFQTPPETPPQAQQPSAGAEVFVPPATTPDNAPQTQPSAPTQAPDAPPMPQEDFDVPAQIVRQARLIRSAENTEMIIKLNPEHLGELTLRVSVSQNGAVNASFHSDNAQVRTIIENSLVQLRQELSNIGLKVEHVDVYAGLSDGGLMNGQGGQAWQQNRQQRQGNRQIDLNALERDVDTTAPVNESTTEGVDYSV